MKGVMDHCAKGSLIREIRSSPYSHGAIDILGRDVVPVGDRGGVWTVEREVGLSDLLLDGCRDSCSLGRVAGIFSGLGDGESIRFGGRR